MVIHLLHACTTLAHRAEEAADLPAQQRPGFNLLRATLTFAASSPQAALHNLRTACSRHSQQCSSAAVQLTRESRLDGPQLAVGWANQHDIPSSPYEPQWMAAYTVTLKDNACHKRQTDTLHDTRDGRQAQCHTRIE